MKIGLIGRIAEGVDLVDGQTIKTKVLLNELKGMYPKATYNIVDSYNCKRHFLTFIINIIQCVKQSDVIFVLLSSNGIKITFPLLFIVNKLYRKPIIHDVIGGRIDELAVESRTIFKCIKSFYINLVESEELGQRLKAIGVTNVEVVPNFKRLHILSQKELVNNTEFPFRFCTFSRVSKAKGISEAIKAISEINKDAGRDIAILDIYGPIENDYKNDFATLLTCSEKTIQYKGCVDYNNSVDVLRNYSALLFPTTFYGEGFPGTIIDAFSAGLPVIATDWHCNPEIIEDGRTGFLYSSNSPEKLKEKINKFIQSPDQILMMKYNCIAKAHMYKPEVTMKRIVQIMDEGMDLYKRKS